VVAALRGVLWVAEVLFHLDLETRFEDLLGELRQQASGADEVLAVGAGLVDELLSE